MGFPEMASILGMLLPLNHLSSLCGLLFCLCCQVFVPGIPICLFNLVQ